MQRRDAGEILSAMALAGACAEGAVRLLQPRDPLPEPAPVELTEHFTADQLARGAAYTRGQLKLSLLEGALQIVGLLGAARLTRVSGGSPDRRSPAWTAGRLVAVSTLISLPVRARGRQRSLAAGLSTHSWRAWARDQTKALAIELPLAMGGGTVLAWATVRWPRRWWVPVSGGAVGLSALLAGVAPVLLDPLFNEFRPLEGELRDDVFELAGRAGVQVGGVMRMDASRRTSAANAYVSGWGPTRRVVLYDTLLDRYSRREVKAVVAHELAHVQGRDVARGLTFTALVAPAATLAVQRLSAAVSPAPAAPAGPPALPGLALAAMLVAGPLGFFAGRLSRGVERRADAVSLELVDDPEAFLAFERRIATQNLADVRPPWWVRQLMATHPSTEERLAMALGYARQGPA